MLYRIENHDLSTIVEAPAHRRGELPATLVRWIREQLLRSWEVDQVDVRAVTLPRIGYSGANEYGVNSIERSTYLVTLVASR